MKNFKKSVIGLSLGLSILLSGCGDNVYTKEQISVDINNKTIYESDGKTLANGTFDYKTAIENGEIILEKGFIKTVVITKGNEKMQAKYKDKKLQYLDMGKYSKVEYFDSGELKYLFFQDNQSKSEVKFKKGEKYPYYILNEAKPTNNKIIYEDDILTISKLTNNQIIETHKKDSQRAQILLTQITSMVKNVANLLSDEMYNNALKEMIK